PEPWLKQGLLPTHKSLSRASKNTRPPRITTQGFEVLVGGQCLQLVGRQTHGLIEAHEGAIRVPVPGLATCCTDKGATPAFTPATCSNVTPQHRGTLPLTRFVGAVRLPQIVVAHDRAHPSLSLS